MEKIGRQLHLIINRCADCPYFDMKQSTRSSGLVYYCRHAGLDIPSECVTSKHTTFPDFCPLKVHRTYIDEELGGYEHVASPDDPIARFGEEK